MQLYRIAKTQHLEIFCTWMMLLLTFLNGDICGMYPYKFSFMKLIEYWYCTQTLKIDEAL